ncbi:1959_t:CDS:2, partial [Rhizophagus irregularis]
YTRPTFNEFCAQYLPKIRELGHNAPTLLHPKDTPVHPRDRYSAPSAPHKLCPAKFYPRIFKSFIAA